MTDATALHELSAVDLVRLTRSGDVSAVELLDAHLAQIDAHNGDINAIVSLDRDLAYDQAAAADALPRDLRGPLHGLPFAVKDLADARGFPTTLGHEHFAHNIARGDSLHIGRMRAAGAVVFGKTNTPAMGAGSHTRNFLFGATRNPYDPTRTAGGSSGGAAAALAARFQPIADGSDMGGSLRNPAAFCGVVGLRPTPGLVPNASKGSAFDPLSTSGPMGRSVADAALVLSVQQGASRDAPGSWGLDVAALRQLRPASLAGLRVAFAPDLGGRVVVEPAICAALTSVAEVLAERGAHVSEDCPDLDGADDAFRTLRAASMANDWGALQEESPAQFNSYFSDNIEQGRHVSGVQVMRAYAQVTRLTRTASRYFDRVDLVLAPTTQTMPFDVNLDWPADVDGHAMSDYLDWMRAAWLFTPLGIPGLSLPVGWSDGLPVGAQLLAGPRQDLTLLRVALALEGVLGVEQRNPFGD